MDASTLSVFIAATQFVNPEAGSPGVQMATLGGIFLVLAFVTDTAWALAAGALDGAEACHRRGQFRAASADGVERMRRHRKRS